MKKNILSDKITRRVIFFYRGSLSLSKSHLYTRKHINSLPVCVWVMCQWHTRCFRILWILDSLDSGFTGTMVYIHPKHVGLWWLWTCTKSTFCRLCWYMQMNIGMRTYPPHKPRYSISIEYLERSNLGRGKVGCSSSGNGHQNIKPFAASKRTATMTAETRTAVAKPATRKRVLGKDIRCEFHIYENYMYRTTWGIS